MIVTCNTCPRQLCFVGSARTAVALLFGWSFRGGAVLLPLVRGA